MAERYYGVKLRTGGWWWDMDAEPMCGSRGVIFSKLKRDRAVPEYAEQLRDASVVPVVRKIVLTEVKTHDRRTAMIDAAKE
jgi:phage gp46-like protein